MKGLAVSALWAGIMDSRGTTEQGSLAESRMGMELPSAHS